MSQPVFDRRWICGSIVSLLLSGPAAAAAAKPASPPQTFVIYFEHEETDIPPEAMPTIDKAVAAIAAARANGTYSHVKVIGYSDSVGSRIYAQHRSQERATVVRDALVRAGVPAREIKTEGRGKRNPEVPTANHVVQPRNRRVRIIIYRPGD